MFVFPMVQIWQISLVTNHDRIIPQLHDAFGCLSASYFGFIISFCVFRSTVAISVNRLSDIPFPPKQCHGQLRVGEQFPLQWCWLCHMNTQLVFCGLGFLYTPEQNLKTEGKITIIPISHWWIVTRLLVELRNAKRRNRSKKPKIE